jgi:phage antirepressor YoqD-like protein
MTVGDLANEYGIPKHTACLIAREAIHAFSRVHKGEAYGLTKTQIATLRPLFLAARPSPRPCSMPLFFVEEDKPMMTVKEVAEALGVSRDLVEKRVRELMPDRMKQGETTFLSEAEVTAVKLRIEQNSSLATSDDHRKLADMPKTALEKQLIIRQAMALQDEIIGELQGQLALAAPKVEAFDRFIDASGSLCIMDAAKTLGQAPLKFFDKLEAAGMIFRRGNDWLPTQYYIEKAYFEVKTRTFGEGEQARITKQTRVTPKGLDGLAKLFSAQVPV